NETIAGPDGVSQPNAVSVDAQNNIYFGNAFSKIAKIANGSGTVTTIGGQFLTGFAGDGGPAASAEFWDPVPSAIAPNGDIYIADFENSRIRKITAFGAGG